MASHAHRFRPVEPPTNKHMIRGSPLEVEGWAVGGGVGKGEVDGARTPCGTNLRSSIPFPCKVSILKREAVHTQGQLLLLRYGCSRRCCPRSTGSNHRRNPGKRYGTPVAKGPSNSNSSTVSLDHNKYLQVDPGHAHWISSPLLEGK